jgi:hypothetical protein
MMLSHIPHRLVSWASAWEHWWTRKSFPHTMGIVRVVAGGWLFMYWAIRLPYIKMLYSSDGLVFPKIPAYMPESLEWLLQIPELRVALAIYTIQLVALATLTIGLHTRLSAFIAFCISWYYFYLSLHLFHTSFDRLYILVLLVLSISSAGEWLSMQAWGKYGSPLKWEKMVSVFPQRLLAFQLTMTYFGVGFQKLWLPGWQGGEMLWYSMMGVWATPLAFKITSYGWSDLYHVGVNMVKMFEVLIPFSFWIRRYNIRWIGMGSGLAFHILVDLLLYIWWFAVLIPMYIVFFSPEEVHAWLSRISKNSIS